MTPHTINRANDITRRPNIIAAKDPEKYSTKRKDMRKIQGPACHTKTSFIYK